MTIEIDREKAAVYGITVDQIRQELFNAFGSRQVATIYHADQRLPGHPGDAADRFQREDPRPTSVAALCVLKTGAAGSIGRRSECGRATARADGRSAAGQPSGPAAVGDDLVQPRARLLARPGGRRDRADRARVRTLPATIVDRLPGHRAGVPGFAEGAGHPGAGGDLRRLRGARHPLRELHPPDHHHLRPAVGRHRRAADR